MNEELLKTFKENIKEKIGNADIVAVTELADESEKCNEEQNE